MTLLASLLLAPTACGDGGDPDAERAEYLARVGEIELRRRDTGSEIDRALSATYSDVDRLLATVAEIETADFDAAMVAAQNLDPPDELADDHAAAITYLEEMSRIAGEITAAVVAGERAELERLFRESARPGFELGATLSDDDVVLFGTGTLSD